MLVPTMQFRWYGNVLELAAVKEQLRRKTRASAVWFVMALVLREYPFTMASKHSDLEVIEPYSRCARL